LLFEATSDANGRYYVPQLPRGSIAIGAAPNSGYIAPCPSGSSEFREDKIYDVHVVTTALMSTTGAPASLPLSALWISGSVFEETPAGRRPVAGAFVDLTSSATTTLPPYSTTLTDAMGRYLLCTSPPGTGTDQMTWVSVHRDNYITGGRWAFPGDADIDFQLSRP